MASNKRGPKVKVLAPSGSFIALGSTATTGATSANTIKAPTKRESPSAPTTLNPSPAKKSKLSLSHHMTRSSGAIQIRRESGEHWEEFAVEVDPHQLLEKVFEAEDINDERVESLLCGAVKQLRNHRLKSSPSPELIALHLTLCYLAKTRPMLFCTEIVVEAFCSLLKRDPTVNFKAKGTSTNNTMISVLSANLLLAAYHDETSWPDTFLKVFVEDSLGERIWVDHEDCKGFVDNILASFNTKMPPKNMLQHDVLQTVLPIGKPAEVASSSPTHPITQVPVEEQDEANSNVLMTNEMREHLDNITVTSRFTHNEEFVTQFVTDIINDQLTRKQAPSEISRNMLKLLVATSGIHDVRAIVSQKLEMWLQNAKLTRPAQDLLLTICINCTEMDTDVIQTLVKLRPKTKPLTNHYMMCLKELISYNNNILNILLRTVLYNELSPARSINNMQIISVAFQQNSEKSTKVLAEFIQEMIAQKEDLLRSLRTLLREIIRTLRYEHFNFILFVTHLTEETSLFQDIEEQNIRERAAHSITDLITLIMFLNISPVVREAVSSSKPDRRETLKNYQIQVANIQRLAVTWLQNVVLKTFRPERNEFLHCLNKAVFMEAAEHYYSKDNWPPENDRNFMFRMTSEVPLLEETLMRLLNMGLTKENPLTPSEAIELSDALIRRAASIFDGDTSNPVLLINNKEIFNLLLKSATYRYPENITLPSNYEPPNMAISEMYWKVWIQLLILTAHNPSAFGYLAWESYPTLAVLIEMSITNHFEFPPPTKQGEDLINRDLQILAVEKQQIIQFETYLAAASTKVLINENNSLLLSKLISMDPFGPPRKPPQQALELFKNITIHLRLGYLLCQCRSPDFLLEIIQRQQKQIGISSSPSSASMPWLVELVESNENNFGMLPVQCLCEFLLGQIGEEETTQIQAFELNKADKNKKKDKRRKQIKLIAHLQNIINSNSHSSKELIEYFMKKLNSRQSSVRNLALRAFILVLNTEINLSDENLNINLFPEINFEDTKKWLLENLPKTPNFVQSKVVACEALRGAVLVEAIPYLVCLYTQFLSLFDLNGDSDLCLQLSRLLIDRNTIVNHLLQQKNLRELFLNSISRVFESHLLVMRRPAHELYSWSNSQDFVIVQWNNGEAAQLNICVVQAMILLLTFGSTESNLNTYEFLLKTWFSEPLPQAFLVDTSEEALLIPDWLKLKMLKSSDERLLKSALRDVDPVQLILAVQSYGMPVTSMELILKALDDAADFAPETVRSATISLDQNLVRNYVEVQWMRGVKTGKKFANFMGLSSVKTEKNVDIKKENEKNDDVNLIDDSNLLESEIKKWVFENNCDRNFLVKLTRKLTQELFDRNTSCKSLTKSFLIQLSNPKAIDSLLDKFNSGEMNSICNIIVTFLLKDPDNFGLAEYLLKAKRCILNSQVKNTTVRHVFERFLIKN